MDSVEDEVTADVKFAQVPHWVLELPLTDKAVRLYAVLSKYADNDDRTSYPGRGTLAKLMRCHRTSVDRAVEELIGAGCITKQRRVHEGRFTSSLYTVHRIPPRRTGEGSRTHATTPVAPTRLPPSHPCDIELEPMNVEPKNLLATAPQTQNKTAPKRDELFETVAQTCGIDWNNLTTSGRGQLNRAVKELRDIQVTPDQIPPRAATWKRTYPDAPLTPTALAKHWAALTPSRQRPKTGRPSCPECDQPLDDHDQQICDTFGRHR